MATLYSTRIALNNCTLAVQRHSFKLEQTLLQIFYCYLRRRISEWFASFVYL